MIFLALENPRLLANSRRNVKANAGREGDVSIQSAQELAGMQRIGSIVARTLRIMKTSARPGMTTAELDVIGRRYLESFGARPAPELVYDFPGATCISVNDEVAHGIPGARLLKAGDLVNIDVSAELDGFFADCGASLVLAPASAVIRRLCACSQMALQQALAAVRAGRRINRVGKAIEGTALRHGFRVIENLAGHGVGRHLHEEPREIANFCDSGNRMRFSAGMVVAIETFVSTGAHYVVQQRDGWTLKTPDRSLVAQYEHTLIVTDGQPLVLTEAWQSGRFAA